ncbi:MAG: hypothetical protein JSR55_06250 [Proteobacteria bacterium]|nr:hypothetical protein [Pseudomonadota bacterium]
MAWAWRNYVERCFGQDQIKPVSGGAEGGSAPGRFDYKNNYLSTWGDVFVGLE